MKMLNIACGTRYHEKWINIDFHTNSNNVMKVNILSGLPFEDNTIDVIYSSHFLEHLSPVQAKYVLQEAKRVLRPKGILRVVVPDLENICAEYLATLESVVKNKDFRSKYEFAVVELLDQLVRVNSGGLKGEIFNDVSNSNNIELSNYILQRTGNELLNVTPPPSQNLKITLDRIQNKLLYLYLKCIRFLIPKNLRDLIFVNTTIGEKHQWMYDRFSMKALLESAGFSNFTIKSYDLSDIYEFNSYFLDIKKDGTPYKGISSLYVEVYK